MGFSMLKGISPLLSPDLLKTLAEMGHGDELVIGDGNFPASTMNARCIRCDGQMVPPLLDAILQLLPLDIYVDAPVTMMRTVPGFYAGEPPIWQEVHALVEQHAPGTKVEHIERFAFYERAKKAFATIQTGEDALYACVILTKGVIGK
jgi:L-fucose mutarotase